MKRMIYAAALMVWAGGAVAQDVMRMAVTTSFHNSGLADVLLPVIAQDLDLEVQLLVVGTGQALKLGQAGDVDAILVHSRSAEEAFVEEGYGPHRREIMYNDFVFIGPDDDPARISEAKNAAGALQAIAQTEAVFVSRGDDSGTHKKELSLWRAAAEEPAEFGSWYKAVGAGMGAALNTASGLDAYILSDRASWLNFGNKGDLAILFSGDPVLFNQYAYLPVSATRHPHVKAELAEKLEGWLTSARAAELINGYTVSGETLFSFNAKP
ncbi:substrate-binding domain-containing protein [Sulfitobacter sp. F26169L]|uniref:substrate-binding domain-containing protein n=1 Tax=Sulfitobacter sp. F26169L TaxID=2996015 RepID=UPI002260C7A7|nr:substrate-binding domain-containing protein [Sulfitobacter sp. F26169L]MCX7567423.1 substrate-binding domain-containing protein [Sulfitobacter sp. F26169L]